MTQELAILIAIVATLILLIVCPSRARMWRSTRLYAEDHEEANMLIDRRRAAREQTNQEVRP
jgi:Tfp pilus assembly protein FimT